MDKEQLDRILDGLEKLAEQLGETAGALWAILAKEAVLSGVRYAVAALFLFTLVGVLQREFLPFVTAYPFEDSRSYGMKGESKRFTWKVVTGVATVVLASAAVACVVAAASRFVNPEYYALVKLIDLIPGQ